MGFQLVVAYYRATRGIGAGGQLMWRLPEDLAYFKRLTSQTRDPRRQNAIVMGRITHEAIGRKLPGRINLVVSGSGPLKDFSAALSAAADQHAETVFVVGGEALYREALASPQCEAVHVTEVWSTDGGLTAFAPDRFFPALDPAEWAPWGADAEVQENATQNLRFRRASFVRVGDPTLQEGHEVMPPGALPHQEAAYLALVRRAIDRGQRRQDRTGTGTRSLFGAQLRFSLRDGVLPLLTTKRVFLRGVVEELLWFVRGDTDARHLAAKGVHIWDANAAAHAQAKGLPATDVGQLGPVYGHQWRRFGATTKGRDDGGVDRPNGGRDDGGVDQLAEVVRQLREDPNSRRIILSAWNPVDLPSMALPPCHLLAQWWVSDGEVSCMVTMRSCDLGLGLPFNIASYALLTHMVAAAAGPGLSVGDLVLSLGDAHVYENHVEALRGMLTRSPRPWPRLRALPARDSLEGYQADDLVVDGYAPHPAVAMAMSV